MLEESYVKSTKRKYKNGHQKKRTPVISEDKALHLEYLNSDYEFNLIQALYQDSKFLAKFAQYLVPDDHIDALVPRYCANVILDFFRTYGHAPNQKSMLVLVKECFEREDKHVFAAVESFIEEAITEPIEDEQFVKDTFTGWLERQVQANITEKIIYAVRDGDAQKVRDLSTRLASLDLFTKDETELYCRDTKKATYRRKHNECRVIPTYLPIDQYLPGTREGEFGARRGYYHLLAAPTNVGKTTTCVHMGSAAVLDGYKVAHVTLESDLIDIRDRYDAAISNTDAGKTLVDSWERIEEHADLLQHRYGEVLAMVKFEPGTLTPAMLRAWLQRLEVENGFTPDLILIDSPDDMKPNGGYTGSNNDNADQVARDLMYLAAWGDYTIWGTSQGNREAMKSDSPDNTMIGKAVEKVQRPRTVVWLCQDAQEAASVPMEARCKIVKNTWGPKFMEAPIIMRPERQQIISEVYDPDLFHAEMMAVLRRDYPHLVEESPAQETPAPAIGEPEFSEPVAYVDIFETLRNKSKPMAVTPPPPPPKPKGTVMTSAPPPPPPRPSVVPKPRKTIPEKPAPMPSSWDSLPKVPNWGAKEVQENVHKAYGTSYGRPVRSQPVRDDRVHQPSVPLWHPGTPASPGRRGQ